MSFSQQLQQQVWDWLSLQDDPRNVATEWIVSHGEFASSDADYFTSKCDKKELWECTGEILVFHIVEAIANGADKPF